MPARLRLVLLLALGVSVTGCSSKPPTAELVSWRTTRDPLPTVQGKLTPKDDTVFVVVRVRATGKGLYRQDEKDKDMYSLKSDDFDLSTPDGWTVKGIGQRNVAGKEFGGSTYRDKPKSEEEVEVVFPAPPKVAERSDLTVRYHDLPELKLDPGKKGK